MSKLPALTSKEVIRALERAGFQFVRQKGSHRIYIKENIGVTVPYHNKDLKPATLKHIIRQSGIDLKDFIQLL